MWPIAFHVLGSPFNVVVAQSTIKLVALLIIRILVKTIKDLIQSVINHMKKMMWKKLLTCLFAIKSGIIWPFHEKVPRVMIFIKILTEFYWQTWPEGWKIYYTLFQFCGRKCKVIKSISNLFWRHPLFLWTIKFFIIQLKYSFSSV